MSIITKLPTSISRPLGRAGLQLAKSSPQMLFAAGIVGVVATAVTASRATLKVEAIIDEAAADLARVEEVSLQGRSDYSDQDKTQDTVVIYVRTAVKLAKLYALPLGIGVLSIACLTGSHHILSKRNAAVTAAYAALDRGFREYRARVVSEFGEDVDRRMRYDSEEYKMYSITPEGVEHVHVARATYKTDYSIYARFFDELCSSWQSVPEYNLIFLKCQQNFANDMLKARGHIFLNEVYDMLDIPRSKEGSVVGWVWQGDGDNYVDFGVWDGLNQKAIDFVNGREGAILLDFNVDGVIYDKI